MESADAGARALKLNRSFASIIHMYSTEPFTEYAIYINDNFLEPVRESGPKKSILVLGAGGFALGRSDVKNDYVYVDIDASLKKISEEDFLKEDLTPNKKFVAMDARAFLMQTKDKFDLIIVDLCRDPVSMPENMATQEFFQSVKNRLNEDGLMISNYWASANLSDAYSRSLDQTLRTVFPTVNLHTSTRCASGDLYRQ
jgi:spermidine synthase